MASNRPFLGQGIAISAQKETAESTVRGFEVDVDSLTFLTTEGRTGLSKRMATRVTALCFDQTAAMEAFTDVPR